MEEVRRPPSRHTTRGKELSDLLEAGHVPIPSKWVDTIKNIHEKHKPDYVPEFKSRLVSCGNFEDAEGVRTDAPTADMETQALVAVLAACPAVPLFSSDIKNAYFQAMPIDRLAIMRQAQGGLPGVDPDAFLIRVPVYRLCDSGRGFWKKIDHDAKEVGLLSSRRVGKADVSSGKTTREQIGCEHLPVSQSCVVTCCS